MNRFLENKKTGVLISLIIIVFYYFYKFYWHDSTASVLSFTKIWLEMSLLFTFNAVGLIFMILFIHYVDGANEKLLENLSTKEQKQVKCGLFIGSFALVILLVILIFCLLDKIDLIWLQLISISFAVIAYIIDKLLHCKFETLKFDKIIIVGLISTFLLSLFFNNTHSIDFHNKVHFIYGFTAGATAFQIFIAGLYFDPMEYSKESVFKLTK